MKRGKKLIVLLGVLVVLLGAAYGAAQLNPEEEEETVYTTIFTLDPEQVTALTWHYSEEVPLVKEEDGWVYEEDPQFPLDTTYVDAMLTALSQIDSSKTIENVENWDEYTLEAAICEINLTVDGEDVTIKVGEETGLGGQRYVSIGDANAYLVDNSFLEPFEYGLYDVLKMEEIPEMDTPVRLEHEADGDSFIIEKQEDSGLAYSDEYIWFLGEKALDTDLTESLLDYVTELAWSECVNYRADDLSKYGLDDPAAVLTLTYTDEDSDEEKTFCLELGDEDADGNYYARLAGSQMIYTIAGSAAESMIYTTYEDLKPTDVLLMDWENVTSLDIVLDGETYTLIRSTKTETDEDGNETQTVVYTLNGEEVDGEAITDLLDDITYTGYAGSSVPETGEEIRFVIHRSHATFPEVELAFYRHNSSDCLVVLNGEPTVSVSRQDVVELVEAVNGEVLD